MEENIFSKVVSQSEKIIERIKIEKLRPLSRKIIKEIRKDELIDIIYGIRGSGKTTLLSFAKKIFKKSLYVSCDILRKYGIDLLEFLEHADKKGFESFFIDEIHFIPNWDLDIKIFFDETGNKIVITGSSSISLSRGSELSRRARYFTLKPLSFREYIYLREGIKIEEISIEDLLDKEKRTEIMRSVIKFYPLFDRYLKIEGLPAAIGKDYEIYLNILNRAVTFDLMNLREVDVNYIDFIIKLMKFVVSSSPGELSYTSLAESLRRSVKFVMETIRLLEIGGLVFRVPPFGKGHKAIRSEDKILLPLSFRSALANSFGIRYDIGAIREDFFVQHTYPCFYLKTGKKRRTPDFVKDNIVFEVGGKSKGKSQIKGFKNAYLVKDTITFEEEVIPLVLFGFLY